MSLGAIGVLEWPDTTFCRAALFRVARYRVYRCVWGVGHPIGLFKRMCHQLSQGHESSDWQCWWRRAVPIVTMNHLQFCSALQPCAYVQALATAVQLCHCHVEVGSLMPFIKGRSDNLDVDHLAQMIHLLLYHLHCSFWFEWIQGKSNWSGVMSCHLGSERSFRSRICVSLSHIYGFRCSLAVRSSSFLSLVCSFLY